MAKIRKTRIFTGDIVLRALRKLMKNTGWTTRTIAKFIKSEYEITDPHLGRKVSRSLKNYYRRGLVQNEGGRFRLRHGSALVRCRSSSELRRSKPCHMRRRRVTKRRVRPRDGPIRIRSRSRSS